jgi:hypothetical protein
VDSVKQRGVGETGVAFGTVTAELVRLGVLQVMSQFVQEHLKQILDRAGSFDRVIWENPNQTTIAVVAPKSAQGGTVREADHKGNATVMNPCQPLAKQTFKRQGGDLTSGGLAGDATTDSLASWYHRKRINHAKPAKGGGQANDAGRTPRAARFGAGDAAAGQLCETDQFVGPIALCLHSTSIRHDETILARFG